MSSRLPVLALSLVLFSKAAIGSVLFDENYTGSNYQPLTPLGVIDLAEGNFVFVNPGQPLPSVGSNFSWLFQTRIDGIVFDNGNIGFTFPGEITVEAQAQQLVTGVTGSTVTASLAAALPSSTNYFRMYYDPTFPLGNSDIPSGTGFGNGTLILEGYFISSLHTYDPINPSGQPGNYDAEVAITYADPNAFLNTAGYKLSLDGNSFFPPQLPSSALILGYSPTASDVLGSVDFSAQFVVIPEASSLLLIGVGMIGAGVTSLWRRRSA